MLRENIDLRNRVIYGGLLLVILLIGELSKMN